MPSKNLVVRLPNAYDGVAIHQLVQKSPPLDLNSVYLYLLQSTYFAQTCAVAELNSQVAAFVSGYLKPENPTTFFLWQVAVSQELRGQGCALRLIKHILKRPFCAQVEYLETTITPDNQASWQLFTKFAQEYQAPIKQQVLFNQQQLGGAKQEEILVTIGPFHTL